MEAKACAKYVRISPLKARRIVNLIRGKSVQEAFITLQFTPHKASPIIRDVLKSAVANAENNHDMATDNLYVRVATVDQGPSLKRFKPRAMGRADAITKKTSHITITVAER